MKFYGLQKMTLLDFPGHVACTLFTGGCNFRCPFCHNALLVTEIDPKAVTDEEDILSFLNKRVGILEGVCVTGGEPLMQPGLPAFLRKVKALGYPVKLDTNGSYPAELKAIVGEGLADYVAMDIKNSPEKYAETIGVPDFDLTPIRESIDFLMNGTIPYEFRTTVVKEFHTKEDILAIGAWIRGTEHYYLQGFTDSGNLIGEGLSALPKEDMHAMLEEVKTLVPSASLRGI